MSLRRLASLALILLVASAPAAAQGLASARAQKNGRAGWEAIRDGRAQDAAEAFALAVDAEPRDPSLHLGAGLAAYLLGRATVAQQSLERALSLAPGYTPAALLLGEILYRGSDITGAIRVFEAALQHAPGEKSLELRLESLRREAAMHDSFFQSQGSHFVVLFEGPADEELARRAVEVLETAYWRIGTTFSIYPEHLLTVVLYTEQQFQDVTRSPRWAAAAYDGRIRIPVRGLRADSAELERILSHELTHAFLHSIAPRGLPTWLNEGLAVYFEPSGQTWAAAQLADSDRRLGVNRLTTGFGGLSGADARLAYAQSASAARVLMEHGGPAAVIAMVQDIAAGETFVAAFERRMLMPYDSFVAAVEGTR